jgi:hypothetical protein
MGWRMFEKTLLRALPRGQIMIGREEKTFHGNESQSRKNNMSRLTLRAGPVKKLRCAAGEVHRYFGMKLGSAMAAQSRA